VGAEERRVGALDGAGYVPIGALYLPPYTCMSTSPPISFMCNLTRLADIGPHARCAGLTRRVRRGGRCWGRVALGGRERGRFSARRCSLQSKTPFIVDEPRPAEQRSDNEESGVIHNTEGLQRVRGNRLGIVEVGKRLCLNGVTHDLA